MLLNLKSKVIAASAAIIVFLLGVVKLFLHRNSQLKQRVKKAEGQLKQSREQARLDAEIEQEFSHRAEEARRDLDEGNIPDHLRNPRG